MLGVTWGGLTCRRKGLQAVCLMTIFYSVENRCLSREGVKAKETRALLCRRAEGGQALWAVSPCSLSMSLSMSLSCSQWVQAIRNLHYELLCVCPEKYPHLPPNMATASFPAVSQGRSRINTIPWSGPTVQVVLCVSQLC